MKKIMSKIKYVSALLLAIVMFVGLSSVVFANPQPTNPNPTNPQPTNPGNFSFQDGTLTDLLYAIIGLFNPIIILLAGICVVVFMWGVIKYINASGDPKRLKEGSWYLLFGIIAFVVIVGLWGIVKTVTSLLGLEFAGPQFKTSRSGTGSTQTATQSGSFGNAQFSTQSVQSGRQVSGSTGYGTTQTTSGTTVSGSSGAGTTQTSGSTQTNTGTQGSGSTVNSGGPTNSNGQTGGGTTNTTGN
ncbi:MAG TPA: pilin [Candidatus Paceibacterota bacterium]|nr:pilin [Candidatus Paceibacterota bacterium]